MVWLNHGKNNGTLGPTTVPHREMTGCFVHTTQPNFTHMRPLLWWFGLHIVWEATSLQTNNLQAHLTVSMLSCGSSTSTIDQAVPLPQKPMGRSSV